MSELANSDVKKDEVKYIEFRNRMVEVVAHYDTSKTYLEVAKAALGREFGK
ncbi:MAG: hypothetical protein FWH07_06890 [Oscillospiraceae bacterium]|nr:hypothetical protein [Oscillospiraceae bacterium]